MATMKSGLVAIAIVVGLAGSSQAQFVTSGTQGGFATFPGAGVTSVNPGCPNDVPSVR